MDIFAMPAAGGDPIQLTKGPADEISAHWSPDGQYLAYVADEGAGTSLYLAGQFGGGQRKLADTGVSALLRFIDALSLLGTTPWSPDGKDLLFARVTPPADTAIWQINVDTGALKQMTFPGTGESDFCPSRSFDGCRVGVRGGRTALAAAPRCHRRRDAGPRAEPAHESLAAVPDPELSCLGARGVLPGRGRVWLS